MNIIKNTPSVPISGAEKKRAVRDKIVEYLHRVETVSDSNALSLLQQTIEVLQKRVEQSSLIATARDSKLNNILQQMQASILKLEAKSDYANAARREIDETSITAKKTMQKLASNSSRNRQIREFTINVMNEVEKKTLQTMLTKDIMIKLQKETKNIRDIARLVNDSIRIQAKSEKTRKSLQKRTEIIRRLVSSITIRIRIYVVRANEIRMNNINTINQTQTIAYLQHTNARLHSELDIKKVA
jgi:hypothetical protein